MRQASAPVAKNHKHGPSMSRPGLFAVCAAILLLAVLGLEPVLAALEVEYGKTSILPRSPLGAFGLNALPSFKLAPEDSPFLDLQADDDVGTDDLLFLRMQEKHASGMDGQIYLFVTYYSDPDDRVPHTPEVCYRQIGGIVRKSGSASIVMPAGRDLPAEVTARTVIIEQAEANTVIAYVFCANGRFYTARNDVRVALGWPGEKRVYFSKIEAVTRSERGEDTSAALQRCRRMLEEAIPELVGTHFPLKEQLSRR